MDDIPISTTVDLTNMPDEVKNQAKDYARLMQDVLTEQKGMTNFYALYASLLVAAANLAMICLTREDTRFPTLLGWAMAVLDDYSEKVRRDMKPGPGEKVH